jgi:hypothetical protein
MTIDRKEMLKKEIVVKGKLQDFEEVLSEIIDDIYDPVYCTISCSDIEENSVNEQSELGSRIRIGFKNRTGDPLNVIWIILHEYGHHLSSMPKSRYPSMEREYQAWDYAYEEIKKYPKLQEHIDSFYEYKDECILDYKRKLGIQGNKT